MRLGCHGLVVQPYWVAHVKDAPLPIISVAGFPYGTDPGELKARAAAWAVDQGAREIDIVLNLGALRSGEDDVVAADIAAVRGAISGVTLKVILETGLLTEAETKRAARICTMEGADFLKTSTGVLSRGATVQDVLLLKPFGLVKASGGIRTWEQAVALVAAGAERLGASASEAILAGDPA